MKTKRRAPARSSRRAAGLSFLAFGLVALAIVVALEFSDFKAGRYSFIFDRLLGRKHAAAQAERFDRGLQDLLAARRLRHDSLRDAAGVAHYKIELAAADSDPLVKELLALVGQSGGVQALSEIQATGERVISLHQVRFGGRLSHVILLSKRLPPPAVAPAAAAAAAVPDKAGPHAKTGGAPQLAIIIDDIGYADLVSAQLDELGIPITGAVIADAPYAGSEARRLHGFGLEVIIHLPTQPQDPANHHPRDQFVLIDSSDAEIEAILDRAQAIVPMARGVNNHMGSLLTADQRAMRRLLGLLKERQLFFVDSRTSVKTVAHAVARALRVPTALRDVFLDDTQSYDYSTAQLRRLVELARQNGRALAIGHPFPSTLAALKDALPWLKQQPLDIVFVSQMLE